MSLHEVINLAKQLSRVEKERLIEQIAAEIERELSNKPPTPRKSLWGLCAYLGKAPTADAIDAVRSEEWANFPSRNCLHM